MAKRDTLKKQKDFYSFFFSSCGRKAQHCCNFTQSHIWKSEPSSTHSLIPIVSKCVRVHDDGSTFMMCALLVLKLCII